MLLALDASTTAVGYVVADGEQCITSGVFKPPRSGVWDRIEAILGWLRLTVEYHEVKLMAYEEPTGDSGNRRTDRMLGALMGAVFCVACDVGIQFIRVHPMRVKATGYHKDAVRDAALLVGKNEAAMTGDEADAIGVWQAFLVMWREQEVLDRLEVGG